MNVHLLRNWADMSYNVTFYYRDGPRLRVMRLGSDGARSWEDVDEAREIKPTLRLPPDALEALLAEAEKVIPASHATERHLTDTVATRDRLLALVEAQVLRSALAGDA